MEGYYKVVTKRTTLKVSTHLTHEEIREVIAKSTGVTLDEIPYFDTDIVFAEIKRQSDKVNEIISEYKALLQSNSKTTIDKYDELHDVGKFILFSDDKFKIEIPAKLVDFPDFVLLHDQRRFGIEHTRLMNEDVKGIIKTVKYFIRKANEIIANELSELSKTVNIFVDLSKNVIGEKSFYVKKFSANERQEISIIISDFIRSELLGGNVPRPDFITQVEITPNKDSRVDLELAERYFVQDNFSDLLSYRISKKEQRANAYRNATEVDRLWLLIVIDDVSSSSGFSIETAMAPIIKQSNFDAIIVFEKFMGRIFPIYTKSI